LCKYQYREIYKTKFEEAKIAMHKCLNVCPVEVIQHLFNQSWRFIDAYQQGLTGKAAEWVMQKQKAH